MDSRGDSPWSTALSETAADRISIRGYDLAELIGTVPFASVVHLLFTGDLPDPAAARLIDAVMVASIDHGAGAPSVLAARTAIAGGATLQAGAAAGLLALGDHHGAAVEASMQVIGAVVADAATSTAANRTDAASATAANRTDAGDTATSTAANRTVAGDAATSASAERVVAEWRAQGRRVPGFGHRQHRTRDPRLDRLFTLAHEAGVPGHHMAAAQAIEAALTRSVGRPLPINIDGAIAALLGEVGFPSDLGNALFIAARLAGILAHANEERQTMAPMRRVDPVHHAYSGPSRRELP